MLMTRFIWQTVLKPLSVTDAKNGAITPSLTPTMHARCDNAGRWVWATWRGITNSSKHLGTLLVLYLGILWMSQFIESSRSSLGVVLGDLVDVGTWGVGGWGGGGKCCVFVTMLPDTIDD